MARRSQILIPIATVRQAARHLFCFSLGVATKHMVVSVFLHKSRHWLIARAHILLLAAFGAALVPAWAATTYRQNEGLSNLGIQSLARDDQGFIWLGTEESLQRFDGHRFMPVSLNVAGSLPDTFARQLLAVSGALYILTPARLLRYDLKLQRLSLVPIADDAGKPAELSSIAAGSDGTIYGGTYNGRLFSWREPKSTTLIADAPDNIATATPKPQLIRFTVEPANSAISSITGLYAGASGLLIASSKGAYLLKTGSNVAQAIRFNQPALNDGAVATFSLHEYPAGVLWIGYWNDALVRFDLKTQTFRWFHPKQPNAGALRSTSIHSFASRPDRLYIGTNRGIVVYHPSCDCLRGLNQPSWNQIGGSGLVTTALVIENDGLWASVWGEGLTRFSLSDEVFQHQIRVDGAPTSLAHPMVYALRATKDKLWLGTYGGGVQSSNIAQQRDGEAWNFQSLPWGKYPVESQFIWSIATASNDNATLQNNLTLGTGMGFYNWRGENVNAPTNAPLSGRLIEFKSADDSKPVQSIRSQLTTADGRRYVGTNAGLYRIENETLVRVDFAASAKDKKLSQTIWSLAEHAGQLWLGTSRGLVRLDNREQFLAWHEPGIEATQLPAAQVLVQKRDAAGNFWIGTSGGLVKLGGDANAPIFERQPSVDKLGLKRINSIEFDAADQLWMGTPSGLLRYHTKTQRIDLYDRRDGLVGDQLNFNSSTNDGRLLYFGALGGLIAFDPTAVPDAPVRLSPRVARLRVGQGAWAADATTLDLKNRHDPVQIELTALGYARPDRVRYAYRWRNNDEAFTELGDAKSVVLSRIPSGANSLEIRATTTLGSAVAGSSLVANTQEAIAEVLTINVSHAWFETLWGRILMLAAAGIALVGWTRWRTWRAVSYAKQLENEVADRTAQLNTASLDLAQSNAKLLQQSRVDPLTGLANRRYLFELAHEKVQIGRAGKLKNSSLATLNIGPDAAPQSTTTQALQSIIMLDLDHFKKINDTYGHASGDAVLRDFAEVLLETVGSEGLAVRYGGEEFLVMLFDIEHSKVLEIAKRLVTSARSRKVHDQRRTTQAGSNGIRYTVSAGVATGYVDNANITKTDQPFEKLIAQADAALYQAKRDGRDRLVEARTDT